MELSVICAGFGGQGVMVMGNLIAYAAMEEGKNVTFFPSYGVEMRGGTANCTIVVSDNKIGSPIVGNPQSAIFMNQPSLTKFLKDIQSNGIVVVNKSLVKMDVVDRQDLKMFCIPSLELARKAGDDRLINLIMVGAFAKQTEIVKLSSIEKVMGDVFPSRHHKMIPLNIEALNIGANYLC